MSHSAQHIQPDLPWPRRRIVLPYALTLILAAACSAGPVRPHDSLTAGADPLRARFNQDVGHTRIVMLAAPT
jgi:hypothetical protein